MSRSQVGKQQSENYNNDSQRPSAQPGACRSGDGGMCSGEKGVEVKWRCVCVSVCVYCTLHHVHIPPDTGGQSNHLASKANIWTRCS